MILAEFVFGYFERLRKKYRKTLEILPCHKTPYFGVFETKKMDKIKQKKNNKNKINRNKIIVNK